MHLNSQQSRTLFTTLEFKSIYPSGKSFLASAKNVFENNFFSEILIEKFYIRHKKCSNEISVRISCGNGRPLLPQTSTLIIWPIFYIFLIPPGLYSFGCLSPDQLDLFQKKYNRTQKRTFTHKITPFLSFFGRPTV